MRRGKTYHLILVDPPKFGRGPDGEVWDLFTHLPALLKSTARRCSMPKRAALVLTIYAIRASALAFDQLTREVLEERGGRFASGRARHPRGRRRAAAAGLALYAVGVMTLRASAAMPKPITSLQNERVKAIRALEMRKVRKETGLFVAEGASILITARDHGFVPETLVYRGGPEASAVARGLVDWALHAGAEVSGGVRGRAWQARLQGQSAEHARRVPAALGASCPTARQWRPPTCGWRWRRCAIPATWAPSCAR